MKDTLLKKIINIPASIIAMECRENDKLNDSLRSFSSKAGRPVYIWKEGKGFYRTDLPHIYLQNTKTFKQVLSHLLKTNNGFVFVLNEIEKYLEDQFTIDFMNTVKIDEDYNNKILITGEVVELPKMLKGKIIETKKFIRYKKQEEIV